MPLHLACTAPSLLRHCFLSTPLQSPKHPSLSAAPLPTAIRKCSHLRRSSRKPVSDSELASDLAAHVDKVHSPFLQRKEALRKSRDLLFGDFCSYLGLEADDARVKWRGAGEEERRDWIRGFVAEWGGAFHPLSLKSVKEMVEECVGEGNPPQVSPFAGFERLKKVMRLS